jgi:hypothetical protein
MPDLQNMSLPEGFVPPVSGPDNDSAIQSASPMESPSRGAGNKQDALINVHMALDLLDSALQKLGSETPEGQIVMKSLGSLTKVFGGKRQETARLGDTEILAMLNRLPNAGGGTPEQKVIQSQPQVPGLSGGGSMSPPAAPPMSPPSPQPQGMPQGMPPQAGAM